MSFSIPSDYIPFIQLLLRKRNDPKDTLLAQALKYCREIYNKPNLTRITVVHPITPPIHASCVSFERILIELFPKATIVSGHRLPYYIACFLLLSEHTEHTLILTPDIGLTRVPFGAYRGFYIKDTPLFWRDQVMNFRNSTAVYPTDIKREIELLYEARGVTQDVKTLPVLQEALTLIGNMLL